MDFTSDELDEMYSDRPLPRLHRLESTAHKMIGIYQVNEYAIEMLKGPVHKPYEKEVEALVLHELGKVIRGFSEEQVERDVREAYKKLFSVLMRRWRSEFFPELV